MYLDQVKECTGLPNEAKEKLSDLLDVLNSKLERNKLKTKYYEAKEEIKNLGLSMPDDFIEGLDTVVGWPAKAVDYLASRSIFDGYVYKGETNKRLERIVADNDLSLAYVQAVQSELINSCVFATVSKGAEDEPEVVINFYSAENATALWNYRKKRIDWGLVVTDVSKDQKSGSIEPTQMMLHSDKFVYELNKNGSGKWTATKKPHVMGRPMMAVMAYRPSIKRPFGKSRISRTVMSLTDSAIRERVRCEIGSEFYTFPQKYLLGADDSTFDADRINMYMTALFMATKDEDGETPKFGQLPQASMQPHMDVMRDLAAQFSGETCVPMSSLGVVHDNPASAEAIYAAKEDLVLDAKMLNQVNGKAMCLIAKMALCVAYNKPFSALTDDELDIDAHFINPAMPSVVTQAPAMVQACAPAPWIAETEVYLEEIGFDEPTRKRLMDAKARIEAQAMIAAEMQQPEQKSATMYEIASIIKSFNSGKISRENAITLFAQLGIDKEEALEMLGDAKDVAETIEGNTTVSEE